MLLGVVDTYKQTPVNFPLFLAGKVLLENRSAPHCPYNTVSQGCALPWMYYSMCLLRVS